jgi:hypothetical protein
LFIWGKTADYLRILTFRGGLEPAKARYDCNDVQCGHDKKREFLPLQEIKTALAASNQSL